MRVDDGRNGHDFEVPQFVASRHDMRDQIHERHHDELPDQDPYHDVPCTGTWHHQLALLSLPIERAKRSRCALPHSRASRKPASAQTRVGQVRRERPGRNARQRALERLCRMCVERSGDGCSEGHPNEGERGLDRRRQFGQRRTRGLVQLILAAKGAAEEASVELLRGKAAWKGACPSCCPPFGMGFCHPHATEAVTRGFMRSDDLDAAADR